MLYRILNYQSSWIKNIQLKICVHIKKSNTKVQKKYAWQMELSYYLDHGQQTPRESFFSKIRNFWAWADKLGWNLMRHLGYFWPNFFFVCKLIWFFGLSKKAVLNFCLIGNHHNILLPRMIESARHTFMHIQNIDLHSVILIEPAVW